MSNETKDLIIVMTKGINDEVSSVGLTLANGAMTAGKSVGLFLTSAAIDLVRRQGVDHTHVQPMEPLKDLLTAFMERGGDVWADSVRGAGTILCVALPLEEEDTSERRSA